MKKQLLSLALLLLASTFAYSQCGTINQVEKGLFKKKVYTVCNIELTDAQLINLFKDDAQYQDVYKPMSTNFIVGTLFYSVGYAMILYPVGESIFSNNDPNWTLAYVGAGLIVASIPFKISYRKKAAEAVSRYNNATGSLDFRLNASPNGIGLVMNF